MYKRILIAEDDPHIANLMTLHLRDLAQDIVHSSNGSDAYALAQEQQWDAMILDIRLPSMDGLEVCRKLREQNPQLPILMVTAKSTELDRVLGLEIGADDYITKPFSVVELTARVKAAMRRAAAHQSAQATEVATISLGGLRIHLSEREASVDGTTLDLTPKEFDLLVHFAKHPGKVFRRAELLDTVWGYGHEGYEHTVNSHINRLRSKLDTQPDRANFITTVWGVGYKFSNPELAKSA